MSLQEVKKFSAGNGEHIPTLEEVLKVAGGRAGLVLELKAKGLAYQTVESVRAAGFKDPVIYASFLHDELTQVRTADPNASLMVLYGSLPRASVAHARRYGASHVGLRHGTATRRLIEAFHLEHLVVFVYTANTPREIQHAISVGVDGVISNFPERIER